MTIVGTAKALSTEENIDGERHQTYTSRFRVQSDTPLESPIAVREATGVPDYNSQYEWNGSVLNPYAYCIQKHTAFDNEDLTRLYWIVTTTHTTKPVSGSSSGGGASGLQTSPLLEKWKISGSYVQGTRIATKHLDGRPIINSSKFPKRIEVIDGHDTLGMRGPTPVISLPTRAQAIFHCNSTPIWGLTPRQLLLVHWDYQILSQGPLEFVDHDLVWWIKYSGWNDDFLDTGTHELIDPMNPDVSKRYRIIQNHDMPMGEALLNGAGRLANLTILPNGFTVPCKIIPEFDFTTLGFPDPLPGPFVP